MKIVTSIIPLERMSEYRGVTKENKDYCVATWKVKGVLDGKMFVCTAWTDDDIILGNNKDISLDCELEIYGKPWKDKIFNDVVISNIKNKGEAIVTPQSTDLPNVQTPIQQAGSMGINLNPDPTDLPF